MFFKVLMFYFALCANLKNGMYNKGDLESFIASGRKHRRNTARQGGLRYEV